MEHQQVENNQNVFLTMLNKTTRQHQENIKQNNEMEEIKGGEGNGNNVFFDETFKRNLFASFDNMKDNAIARNMKRMKGQQQQGREKENEKIIIGIKTNKDNMVDIDSYFEEEEPTSNTNTMSPHLRNLKKSRQEHIVTTIQRIEKEEKEKIEKKSTKRKKKKKRYRPVNLKLVTESQHEQNNEKMEDSFWAQFGDNGNMVVTNNYEITSSGKFELDALRIGSQGIDQFPNSFATQSSQYGISPAKISPYKQQRRRYSLHGRRYSENMSMDTPMSDQPQQKQIFATPVRASIKHKRTSFSLSQQHDVIISPPPPESPNTRCKRHCKKMTLQELQFVNELGRGASSVVWKAIHDVTKEEYAVKAIDLSQLKGTMIESELKVLFKCRRSPHIIRCFNSFFKHDKIYIILEYMRAAKSFEDILKEYGVMPEHVLMALTTQVLKGLAFLHKRSIVHRDIKPANILCSVHTGHVKLSDFGLTGSRHITPQSNPLVFKTYQGSLLYMSPERIKEREHSLNCDNWSLGIMLLELSLGKLPIPPSTTYFDMLEAIEGLHQQLTFPKDASHHFQQFIKDCLVVDPLKRPSSATLLQHPWLAKAMMVPDHVHMNTIREWIYH